ncbi:MAG: IS1182 family transposase [Gemmatimonadota bacterium]|nr:IS1182 family transposase [Gemmatimonadota bacterium]
MGYIEGSDRDQTVLFPEVLDEYVTAENPVRFLDAFVASLDLAALGFQRATPSETGRPAYDPGDLLRLYLYGYLYRVRSSRKLEQETHRNVELIWLLRRLRPDFKTIADFRRDNPQALRAVCREFTLLCKHLDLFGGELVAIDGSKFRAVNSKDRNFSRASLERLLAGIDARIAEYLGSLDTQDHAEEAMPTVTATELQQKIERLRARRERFTTLLAQLDASGETQISLTDPESRSMKVRGGTEVCYNVQTAVDDKHKLIVANDVTNAPTDRAELSTMASAANAVLAATDLNVIADMGYYSGPEVVTCLNAGITPTLPRPLSSANAKHGLYTKEDFAYDAARDEYRCPAGATLTYRFSTIEQGRGMRYYSTSACGRCAIKARCTRNKDARRITRWEQEAILEAMERRLKANPELGRRRKAIVEHPFGTMKRGMDQGYFLLRGLYKVRAEFSLTVLAYNLKRVINIVGVPRMVAALT